MVPTGSSDRHTILVAGVEPSERNNPEKSCQSRDIPGGRENRGQGWLCPNGEG